MPGGCRKSQILGPQTPARLENHRTCLQVFGAPAPVGAQLQAGRYHKPTVADFTIFLHDHAVGARGHQRAGDDPHSLPVFQRAAQGMTGRRAARIHGQEGRFVQREITVPQGIAVDGCVVRRRDVACGGQVFGEHAPERGAEVDLFGRHGRFNARFDERDGGIDAHEIAALGEAIVFQLNHLGSSRLQLSGQSPAKPEAGRKKPSDPCTSS